MIINAPLLDVAGVVGSTLGLSLPSYMLGASNAGTKFAAGNIFYDLKAMTKSRSGF
jgi:hypothetical protein